MTHSTPWFMAHRQTQAVTARVFCFPYAGGSASIFRRWLRYFHPSVELIAVQLPGHEWRYAEPLMDRIESVVEAIYSEIIKCFDLPFCFFGHSNGAIIAYELACLLQSRNRPLPFNLIVAAKKAPQLADSRLLTHQLPDIEFIATLRSLEGTPTEVLDNPELIALLLPILRADFAMAETYEYIKRSPLHCPITAFGGLRDAWVSEQDIAAWRIATLVAFQMRMFDAGHLFIHEAEESLAHAVNTIVMQRPLWR